MPSMFCFRLISTDKPKNHEYYLFSLVINSSLKNANTRTNADLLHQTHIILTVVNTYWY
jgi:hypothetical protein